MNLTDVPGITEERAACLRRAGIENAETLAGIEPDDVNAPPFRREHLTIFKWRAHAHLEATRGAAHEHPSEEKEVGAPQRAERKRGGGA